MHRVSAERQASLHVIRGSQSSRGRSCLATGESDPAFTLSLVELLPTVDPTETGLFDRVPEPRGDIFP